MDLVLGAAARALATGDPLGALKLVALRADAHGLALHGIAMAQLGELAAAGRLLDRAARVFGPEAAVERARCAVARAEIALAAHDLAPGDERTLFAAIATLDAHGDHRNARHGRLIAARRHLVVGRIDLAERALSRVEFVTAPPVLAAIGELVAAEIAIRRVRSRDARDALDRAAAAARRAGITALSAEIAAALGQLAAPAARVITAGAARPVHLDEVEAVRGSADLVIDGCRRTVGDRGGGVSLATRPVLFALAGALGEAWPGDAARDALIASAFGSRRPDASHRARLRVELGRLRRELRGIAGIDATARGFALVPRRARAVVVLVPPIDGPNAALLALLAGGEAWSTPALALALGASQRTVQRALAELEAGGQVRSQGSARARRWLAPPLTEFTTALLLPALPIG
jgi:hypothetical protein